MKFHHRCAGIALFFVALGASSFSHAAPVSGQGTWETTLQGRDLDGNLSTFEAYYDTALNITWLADANYAQTSGYDSDGRMDWFAAHAWVASLNPYGSGITGWHLPNTIDTIGPDGSDDGCQFSYSGTDCGYNVDTATSDMAHMFYVTLSNKAYYDTLGSGPQPGWGLTNTGPFSNLQSYAYWSAKPGVAVDEAWFFQFTYGQQDNIKTFNSVNAWAVHGGDVGTSMVPVPAALWLFGSGLAGLIGFARCRKRAV